MALEFKMPKLGESVTEGTIGRWLKQPGDTLAQYEPMLEVTTDKVDTEVSAPIDGRLAEILVPEGETVSVGTIIARLEPVAASDSPSNGARGAETAATPAASVAQPQATPAARSAPISPVVARLVAEHGVDLQQISGTGAGGRVTKKDVEAFVTTRAARPQPAPAATPAQDARVEAELQQTLEVGPRTADEERVLEPAVERSISQPVATPGGNLAQPGPLSSSPGATQSVPAAAPEPGPDDELVPLSPMRRAIAEHMVRSKRTAPHVTTVMEADLSRIVAHRTRARVEYERQDVKLTFTPYFVQAVVAGLQAVPVVNASFSEAGMVMHQRIHIGMAVAIRDGLIVPVIKDADEKSLLGLARTVNDLAERARTRRLQPDDTQDGTFTITNHGVSGSLFAMPVINQPQAAILGIGAMQKRAVVISENGLDAIAIRPMCYLSLTFDHRLIDGATADSFLATVKRTLESYGG